MSAVSEVEQPQWSALVSARFTWDYPLGSDEMIVRMQGVEEWRDQFAPGAPIEVSGDPDGQRIVVDVIASRGTYYARPQVVGTKDPEHRTAYEKITEPG